MWVRAGRCVAFAAVVGTLGWILGPVSPVQAFLPPGYFNNDPPTSPSDPSSPPSSSPTPPKTPPPPPILPPPSPPPHHAPPPGPPPHCHDTPEPATLLSGLIGAGLAGLYGLRRPFLRG